MPTITKTVTVDVEVDVDIDLDDCDVSSMLDDDDLIEEAESRGMKLVDLSEWIDNQGLISRAIAVVRAMPNRPRELEDFFYKVHGEAM